MARTATQIAAQVAVEAVVSEPSAYSETTRRAVLEAGRVNGVSDFYLDMLIEVLG